MPGRPVGLPLDEAQTAQGELGLRAEGERAGRLGRLGRLQRADAAELGEGQLRDRAGRDRQQPQVVTGAGGGLLRRRVEQLVQPDEEAQAHAVAAAQEAAQAAVQQLRPRHPAGRQQPPDQGQQRGGGGGEAFLAQLAAHALRLEDARQQRAEQRVVVGGAGAEPGDHERVVLGRRGPGGP